jgi:DNA repair photolyase
MSEFRWELADGAKSQASLFDEPIFEREPGRGEFRGMEFLHVRSHRIINEVRNAPFGFRYTINPYRGCSHACTYCFSRPSHTYLGLDAGEDFERRIVVKVNAVSLLRSELNPRRWSGDLIAMGTNTDPYQRCEGKFRLTRSIVEVLSEHANPFSILTKSTLVLRDTALLAEAAKRTNVRVNLSIGTLDKDVWRTTEPGTPNPMRRVRAVEALNAAGIPCGVLVAPVLPGISDRPEQLEAVVKACVEAGAQSISTVLLHLRPGVKEVFMPRLARSHPHLVAGYERRYGERAYAPRNEQQDLAKRVHDLVRSYGGVAADRLDPRHHTGSDDGDHDREDDEIGDDDLATSPVAVGKTRNGQRSRANSRRTSRERRPSPVETTQLRLL